MPAPVARPAPPALTRVLLPRRRPGTVVRRRLLDAMHAHVERRLHMVVAPAGYGKTTLLVDFTHEAREHGVRVCWLTLDERDADPRSFFEDLLLALTQQLPRLAARGAGILQGLDDAAREARAVANALCNELLAVADEFVLLVLDDYQVVHDSASVQTAMDCLLERMPSGFKVAIGSRTIPTHIDIVKLAARLEVHGVGVDDLRFTFDEAAALIRQRFGVDVHPREAERAVQRAEGWATALSLSLQVQGGTHFANLLPAKSHGQSLFDYLASQVFNHLGPEAQRFLLDSSVLPALSASECDAVLGRKDSAERLPELMAAGLFLQPLGQDDQQSPAAAVEPPSGPWYRYHELWRSFLLWRLGAEQPARLATLRQAAARRALDAGDLDAAIRQLASSGGDPADAARAVLRAAEAELASGRAERLLSWLDLLPELIVDQLPLLWVHRARALRRVDRAKAALEATERAERLAGQQRDWNTAYLARAWRAEMLAVLGSRSEAVALASDILDFSKRQRPPARVLTQLEKEACLALAMAGRYRDAIPHGERALAGLATVKGARERHYASATMHHTLGICAARLGDLGAAERHYAEARRLWHVLGNVAYEAALLNMHGLLCQERGQNTRALQIFGQALILAERAGHASSQVAILNNSARSARSLGDLDSARRAAEKALPLARQLEERRLLGEAMLEASLVARRAGERGEALHCAQVARDVALQDWPAGAARASAVLAAVAARASNRPEAAAAIREAQEALTAGPTALERLRSETALAAAYAALGHEATATERLRATRRWARDTGRLHLFYAECAEFPETARLALAGRGIPDETANYLRAALAVRVQAPLSRGPGLLRELARPTERHSFEIRLFGTPVVLCNGHPVGRWRTRLAQELLFYLALRGDTFVRGETLVEALLPEELQGRGQTALHYAVHHLRRVFAPQSPIVSSPSGYRLALDEAVHCDAVDFQRLIARSRALAGDALLETLETAVRLYRGALLDGQDAEWAQTARADFERQFLGAAKTLLTAYERARRHDAAIALAQDVISFDPFLEEFHLALLRHQVATGNLEAARRHYELYSQVMRTELGQEPALEARQLLAGSGNSGAS